MITMNIKVQNTKGAFFYWNILGPRNFQKPQELPIFLMEHHNQFVFHYLKTDRGTLQFNNIRFYKFYKFLNIKFYLDIFGQPCAIKDKRIVSDSDIHLVIFSIKMYR